MKGGKEGGKGWPKERGKEERERSEERGKGRRGKKKEERVGRMGGKKKKKKNGGKLVGRGQESEALRERGSSG